MRKNKIMIVSDLHLPYHNLDAVEIMIDQAIEKQPTHFIVNGDMFDLYTFSAHRRSVNGATPEEELSVGRVYAEEMFDRLQKNIPKCKLFFTLGNHEQRIMKRVLEKMPELETLIRKDLFNFKGVTTLAEGHCDLHIDDILISHGFSSNLGAHRDRAMCNCVVGHSHRGGVVFRGLKNKVIWELNTGTLCDFDSKVFGYTPMKEKGWTLGYGFIQDNVPMFVPIELEDEKE